MNNDDYEWTETLPQSAHYISPTIQDIARESGARTILDAGCGNGVLAEESQRDGYDVTTFNADIKGIARTLSDLLRGSGFVITGVRGVGRMTWLWKSIILIARQPV